MTLLMFRARLIFQSIICQESHIIKMCNVIINIIFIFQFLDAFLVMLLLALAFFFLKLEVILQTHNQ